MKFLFPLLTILVYLSSCANSQESKHEIEENQIFDIEISNPLIENRDSILVLLENKIANHEPLIVHAFVALYGYNKEKYDGMAIWEDGMDPNTNLYWGSGYGFRTYFKRYDNWELVHQEQNISDTVLERLIFKKTFSNNAEVYLIADAYIGYEMKTCLKNYFDALTEQNLDSITLNGITIAANGNANLIVFNGHNGLMDNWVEPNYQKCSRLKETAVIACYSGLYFTPYLVNCYTYPLMITKELIPAEAYILSSIIEAWALLKTENEIIDSVLEKYCSIHNYRKDQIKYMFKSGWDWEE